jgi:uncharacterized membrane protein
MVVYFLNSEQKSRLSIFTRKAAILLLIGLGYYLFVKLTGWGIPCPFYLLTEKYCPGCGISRMCMALLEMNLQKAFHYNALVLLMLPFAAIFGIRRLVLYIRNGDTQPDRIEQVFLIIAAVLVFAFWILRNLPNSPFPAI